VCIHRLKLHSTRSTCCLDVPYLSTLRHKRHDFRKENVTEHKGVFWFSLQLLPETFLILRIIKLVLSLMYVALLVKYPLFLSDLNEPWSLPTDFFEKYLPIFDKNLPNFDTKSSNFRQVFQFSTKTFQFLTTIFQFSTKIYQFSTKFFLFSTKILKFSTKKSSNFRQNRPLFRQKSSSFQQKSSNFRQKYLQYQIL